MQEKLLGEDSFQLKLPHIEWLSDFIRLEIVLWERIDTRLRQEHNLSLAFFEVLYFLVQKSEKKLRVGDLARLLGVTVGGTSKLIDRIERVGFIRREADPSNRRASLIALSSEGEKAVLAASRTFEAEMTSILDPVLNPAEQHQMHTLIARVLRATTPVVADATD